MMLFFGGDRNAEGQSGRANNSVSEAERASERASERARVARGTGGRVEEAKRVGRREREEVIEVERNELASLTRHVSTARAPRVYIAVISAAQRLSSVS